MEDLTFIKGDFILTTNQDELDIDAIHDFLCNQSHWSKGIPIETVKTSIKNSLNFGLFNFGNQIGYARVISDFATIGYLGDIYILREFRNLGLSKWLLESIMGHPNLQNLRRWILLTSDAHDLYRKYGWSNVDKPALYMEIYNPSVYFKS